MELPSLPLSPVNLASGLLSSHFSTNTRLHAFPNLRSLQENHQMSFFFSIVVALQVLDDGDVGGCNAVENLGGAGE
ncbi:hypothetical protein U1Q18_007308 [Sarracenia purpurea var. burkii]